MATAILLALGLWGVSGSFEAAILLSAGQTAAILIRDRRVSVFPVQLRVAYILLLVVCLLSAVDALALLAANRRHLCIGHLRVLPDGTLPFPVAVESP